MESEKLGTGIKSSVQHSASAGKHALTQALASMHLTFSSTLKILGIKIHGASMRVKS